MHPMNFCTRSIAVALLIGFPILPISAQVGAPTFSAEQRQQIEQIIKDYLMSHPELLQDALG
jgi:hypothetical protein